MNSAFYIEVERSPAHSWPENVDVWFWEILEPMFSHMDTYLIHREAWDETKTISSSNYYEMTSFNISRRRHLNIIRIQLGELNETSANIDGGFNGISLNRGFNK